MYESCKEYEKSVIFYVFKFIYITNEMGINR